MASVNLVAPLRKHEYNAFSTLSASHHVCRLHNFRSGQQRRRIQERTKPRRQQDQRKSGRRHQFVWFGENGSSMPSLPSNLLVDLDDNRLRLSLPEGARGRCYACVHGGFTWLPVTQEARSTWRSKSESPSSRPECSGVEGAVVIEAAGRGTTSSCIESPQDNRDDAGLLHASTTGVLHPFENVIYDFETYWTASETIEGLSSSVSDSSAYDLSDVIGCAAQTTPHVTSVCQAPLGGAGAERCGSVSVPENNPRLCTTHSESPSAAVLTLTPTDHAASACRPPASPGSHQASATLLSLSGTSPINRRHLHCRDRCSQHHTCHHCSSSTARLLDSTTGFPAVRNAGVSPLPTLTRGQHNPTTSGGHINAVGRTEGPGRIRPVHSPATALKPPSRPAPSGPLLPAPGDARPPPVNHHVESPSAVQRGVKPGVTGMGEKRAVEAPNHTQEEGVVPGEGVVDLNDNTCTMGRHGRMPAALEMGVNPDAQVLQWHQKHFTDNGVKNTTTLSPVVFNTDADVLRIRGTPQDICVTHTGSRGSKTPLNSNGERITDINQLDPSHKMWDIDIETLILEDEGGESLTDSDYEEYHSQLPDSLIGEATEDRTSPEHMYTVSNSVNAWGASKSKHIHKNYDNSIHHVQNNSRYGKSRSDSGSSSVDSVRCSEGKESDEEIFSYGKDAMNMRVPTREANTEKAGSVQQGTEMVRIKRKYLRRCYVTEEGNPDITDIKIDAGKSKTGDSRTKEGTKMMFLHPEIVAEKVIEKYRTRAMSDSDSLTAIRMSEHTDTFCKQFVEKMAQRRRSLPPMPPRKLQPLSADLPSVGGGPESTMQSHGSAERLRKLPADSLGGGDRMTKGPVHETNILRVETPSWLRSTEGRGSDLDLTQAGRSPFGHSRRGSLTKAPQLLLPDTDEEAAVMPADFDYGRRRKSDLYPLRSDMQGFFL